MLLIFLAIITALVWSYILWGRPFLASRFPVLFRTIYEIEASLWSRSRTILIARLYWVGGALIAIHDALAGLGLDWTPVVQQVTRYVPAELQPFALAAFLAVTGASFEWLRRVTTASVEEGK